MEACCTCAELLSTPSSEYEIQEKTSQRHARVTPCCGRHICNDCMNRNPRFRTYCPFCQISEGPSTLPPGLRDPPAYSPPASPVRETRKAATCDTVDEPPAYQERDSRNAAQEKPSQSDEDVLHFVDPMHDSIRSLSLRYAVPADAIRRLNNLYSDHLIQARRTVLIPGEFYKGGVSLSPRPVEGEEEEMKRIKIRKWMVACKVSEYDIALVYMKQADFDLDEAVTTYLEDEKWAKEHPLDKKNGKSKADNGRNKKRFGFGLAGQI